MLDPPYRAISRLLQSGRVVPFLGAGASLVSRPSGVTWKEGDPFLPLGGELSNCLADEANYPTAEKWERADLAKVSSYYADVIGRRDLRGYLRKILGREYAFGKVHEFLASFERPLLIVVTNYDTLLEDAFVKAERPYDLVVYPSDLRDNANAVLWWPNGVSEPRVCDPVQLEIDLEQTTVIFKMHGTLHKKDDQYDTFVVTEEDYIDFISRMTMSAAIPAVFSQYMRDRSFLFLGYGLRDWNLRVLHKNLGRYLRQRSALARLGDDEAPKSWAIQLGPSELEKKLWAGRGVEIFDQDLDRFIANLRATVPR
jgi:hypothetical protein